MTTHRAQLRAAVRDLSDRGLKCSAKWAAEQLVGLAGGPLDDEAGTSDAPMSPAEEVGSREEEDQLLLAKAYFDLNEFKRAAHALRVARGASGRFLRWYSLFLAGQKRQAEEEAEERSGGVGHAFWKDMGQIERRETPQIAAWRQSTTFLRTFFDG
ncbi:hypothetical protein EMIHUDRAFT_120383 [Emiliania huxleyi CCMP1516]|uniref:Cdc23 domain-containing protein n=2 Tax=Emiliania huxleyi TaxID=2903 RepID=A0A0D3IJ21_EMIH1|nr:hypothetical protein EMIHUDRAFT_120383 [Emiliania huxleyi CCMP1516]EOD11256.1 hypothetical protein EMIHUDRAFT_120383 [Emiliania huxleyi CCMP1516]|eukprot:XP_005763685.1 hypothetical protein EMIHUDRAFT_120383 [Emiliania huxleyi CCMP1516]